MDQKKTGAFLRELRKEKQLTQEQLAEKLGVTNRSVSRWETGVNMRDFAWGFWTGFNARIFGACLLFHGTGAGRTDGGGAVYGGISG